MGNRFLLLLHQVFSYNYKINPFQCQPIAEKFLQGMISSWFLSFIQTRPVAESSLLENRLIITDKSEYWKTD